MKYTDVRIGVIRKDFDSKKHGNELSFYSTDEPIFSINGSPAPEGYSDALQFVSMIDDNEEKIRIKTVDSNGSEGMLDTEFAADDPESVASGLSELLKPHTELAESVLLEDIVLTLDSEGEIDLDMLTGSWHIVNDSDQIDLDSLPAAFKKKKFLQGALLVEISFKLSPTVDASGELEDSAGSIDCLMLGNLS